MAETFRTLATFRGSKAWDALDIAEVEGASIRVHWTNQPYIWHVNDGTEVFLVLDGIVDMHVREDDCERRIMLSALDVFVAQPGDAHVAHPRGEARILVIERKGSV